MQPNSAAAFVNSSSGKTVAASVTPLASILGSGLLIIVPVLEATLGRWSVFGAVAICGVAWLIVRQRQPKLASGNAGWAMDPRLRVGGGLAWLPGRLVRLQAAR